MKIPETTRNLGRPLRRRAENHINKHEKAKKKQTLQEEENFKNEYQWGP